MRRICGSMRRRQAVGRRSPSTAVLRMESGTPSNSSVRRERNSYGYDRSGVQLGSAGARASDVVPGACFAALRQHATGRIVTRDRQRRRAAGVLPVLANDRHGTTAPRVVRRSRGRDDPAAARSARARHTRHRVVNRLARAHPQLRPDTQRDLGRQIDVEPDAAAAAAGSRAAASLR